MPLKVIITGAYSTGKSTLVRALAGSLGEAGHRVRLLPDVARECPFPLNRDQSEDGTLWLVTTQIAREVEAMAEDVDIVLCDRGVIDVLAHQLLDACLSQRGRVDLLSPFLEDWLRSYDCVLRSTLDASIEIVPDGLRDTNADYRSDLARLADLVTADLRHLTVLPCSPDAAAVAALAAVRQAISRALTMPAPESAS